MNHTYLLLPLMGLMVPALSLADVISGVKFSDFNQKVLIGRGVENTTAGFIAALGSTDPTVRMDAAQALGERRGPESIAALTAALSDGTLAVRYHAAKSLVAMKNVAGAAVLREASLDDSNLTGSIEAAGLLADLGDPSGYERVLAGLRSAHPSTRLRAVVELPKFRKFDGRMTAVGRIDTVGVLGEMLGSAPGVATRVNAAYLLGRTGDERARSALTAAAAGVDRTVADAARIGLAALDQRR